jgi:hypothetical protein
MMRDIATGAATRIELLEVAPKKTQHPLRLRPAPRCSDMALAEDESEEVGNRSLFDDENPIHIGFAKLQFGIDEDVALGSEGLEADGDGRAGTIAQDERGSVGRGNPQISASDN